MRITIVYPCIGRRVGEPYIRGWQMEPLAPAVLASLTPEDVEIKFYDDRMEPIPFDESTDLVAISIETYTAKRAYQIASEYRRRGVPVVMGGFHATLASDEVCEFAESVVIGEAEELWPQLVSDFLEGRMRRVYRNSTRPSLAGVRPDRSIFQGKKYLPIGLVEAGRGCNLRCEFCAIQSFFSSTQNRRPVDDIIDDIRHVDKPFIFFVDDNFTSHMDDAKTLMRRLAPLKIKWVSQASIHAAHDEEFLRLARDSGCQGLLVGLESLNPDVLKRMSKTFNLMKGGYDVAFANFRKYGIRLYITFMLGYDGDSTDAFRRNVSFAKDKNFFVVSFNHVTPFPGTPLYEQLNREGRLLYDRWWLDPDYLYGMLPFVPTGMSPEEARLGCLEARADFFSLLSILKRALDPRVNTRGSFAWHYFIVNFLMRREVSQREKFPLGDESYAAPLLKVKDPIPVAACATPDRRRKVGV